MSYTYCTSNQTSLSDKTEKKNSFKKSEDPEVMKGEIRDSNQDLGYYQIRHRLN